VILALAAVPSVFLIELLRFSEYLKAILDLWVNTWRLLPLLLISWMSIEAEHGRKQLFDLFLDDLIDEDEFKLEG
jgi:hypothetical protein